MNYALNQKPYMKNYLKDGRCSISNNAAEQAVKSYVMERKNFLFHDTVKGATARITAKSFLSATLDSTSRKQISWISTTLPDASLTRILLTGLQLANIYLNTGISLSPVLQAVVKLKCPVPLAWRHVSSISIPGMSAFLICLLI